MVALPNQEEGNSDPHSLIFDSDLPVVATWQDGELAFAMN